MNVVDSSGWLEYFADGPNADFFAPAVENVEELIVPAVSIYEVFKRVLPQRDEDEALQVVAAMARGQVVALDMTLALSAAKVSTELGLPMADSIICGITRRPHSLAGSDGRARRLGCNTRRWTAGGLDACTTLQASSNEPGSSGN